MQNHYPEDQQSRGGVAPAQKLMFMVIGGGIGAATALLFARKSGTELRSEIAGLVDKGYDKALIAAGEIKERTSEFYEVAKGTSGDVLEVISSRLSLMKDDVRSDVGKVGSILKSSPICCATPDTKTRYRFTEPVEIFKKEQSNEL